jgi:O-antigen ligase
MTDKRCVVGSYWLMATLMFSALVMSRGRAGLGIAILLTFFLMLMLRPARRLRYKIISDMKSIFGIILVFGTVVGFLFTTDYKDEFLHRYTGSVTQELNRGSGSTYFRLQIFRGLMEALSTAPCTGIGAGTFLERSSEFISFPKGVERAQPHNTYVGLLTESGPVALVGLFLVIAAGLQVLRVQSRNDKATSALISGIGCAFLAVTLNLLTFDGLTRYGFWFFWSLSLVVIRLHSTRDGACRGNGSRGVYGSVRVLTRQTVVGGAPL